MLRAYDPKLKRDVALKLLRHDDPQLAKRMLLEAQAQARVKHPHVCPVYETGTTDGGQLYIAMQLIEGDALDVAAGEMSLEEKAGVLREVASAVQAAHAAGLIHRDLKPGNIMVERLDDGSWKPWVMDFGIARQHDAPGLTVTGQVMGTPAYMPPEQARGDQEAVDRRSDVYALGAVLYHLLTGRPPFTGQSTVEVLVHILQDEPVRVRKLAPQIPTDLETIAMTCLEKDPERRYRSARALAEDLTRYLEGEPIAARPAGILYRLGKKVRKNKWATALATVLALGLPAGAIKYTLDLDSERRRALAAQQEAEDLTDFMLEDLYDRLRPLGRVDLLEEVARESLRHYEEGAEDDLDPGALHRRARALRNVGRVLEAEGDTEESLAFFERYRSIMARLHAREPANLDWRHDLAMSHRLVGETLQEQGRLDEALVSYREALEFGRGLAALAPERTEELWEGYANVGWLQLERGELDEAMENLQASLSIARQQTTLHPDDAAWRENLVSIIGYIGFVHQERGDDEAALATFTEALEESRAIATDDPSNTRWQFELALNHGRIAYLLQDRDDLEGAVESFRQAATLHEELADQDPANARWQRELAVSYSGLGSVLRRRGELEAASDNMEKSLGISRRLADRDPTNVSMRNDLAWDLIQLGMVREALAEPAAARAAWEEAVVIITPIAEATDVPYYRDTQVLALLNLGRVEEARPIVEKLLASGWDDAEFLELCRQHGLVGSM